MSWKDVTVLTRIRGIFFGLAVLITSIFGCYVIMLFLPLLFFDQHRLWRICIDKSIGFWLLFPLGLLKYLFGIQYCVTGDPISATEPALIIMNHRTRLDWLFFWGALYKMNPWLLTTEKITIKAPLKSIPGAGWAMAANAFVFLDRNRDTDNAHLSEAIDYYSEIGVNYQILLFPEGTDKSRETTRRSDEYARKHGLQPFEHVIYPRTAGVAHLLQKMRKSSYIKCIYDVTVAYPDRIVQTEWQLGMTGMTPKTVHFDIRRIAIDSVPNSERGISDWLNRLWQEKDQKLTRFFARPRGGRHFVDAETAYEWPLDDDTLSSAYRLFALLLWLIILIMWSWHAFILPFIQICLICAFFVFLFISLVYGGIDKCVLYRWKMYKQSKGAPIKRV